MCHLSKIRSAAPLFHWIPLLFSREVLEGVLPHPQEIAIATDGFHPLRAAFYAAHMGLKAYSIPSSTPWGCCPAIGCGSGWLCRQRGLL